MRWFVQYFGFILLTAELPSPFQDQLHSWETPENTWHGYVVFSEAPQTLDLVLLYKEEQSLIKLSNFNLIKTKVIFSVCSTTSLF